MLIEFFGSWEITEIQIRDLPLQRRGNGKLVTRNIFNPLPAALGELNQH
jgi:hypothetical protein